MNIVDVTNFLDERGVEYKFLTRLSITANIKVEVDMKLIEDYLKKYDVIGRLHFSTRYEKSSLSCILFPK